MVQLPLFEETELVPVREYLRTWNERIKEPHPKGMAETCRGRWEEM